MNQIEVTKLITEKLIEVAKKQHNDASNIQPDDIIPMTGYLDSIGILELIVWYERKFSVKVDQSDVNIDNFGSINLMIDYLNRSK